MPEQKFAFDDIEKLPPFPAIARKLLAEIAKPNAQMNDVARLVQSDVVFSVETLRLANSAIFCSRTEVVSVLHAISVLGLERLRALVLTVGLRDFMRSARSSEQMKRVWRHSLATALICEALAPACWHEKPTAYTVGLLHDIGLVAMTIMHPQACREAFDLAAQPGRTLFECEQEVLGTDHQTLGMYLADLWDLPESLRAAISGTEEGGNSQFPLGRLSTAACEAAARMGFSVVIGEARWSPEDLRALLPADSWAKAATVAELLPEQLAQKINLFECEFLAAA